MAIPSHQYYGHERHELSSYKIQYDLRDQTLEYLYGDKIELELPGRRAPDRNALDMHEQPKLTVAAPVRSRSLDQRNVNGTLRPFPRADSAIGMEDDDEDECCQPKAAISPLTILGAGRVDPFAKYPVKMNVIEYWLIDHVNVAQHPTFKVFKESWLPAAMSDPAAFHQILSNIALSISIVRGQGVILDNPVSVAHNSLAVRTVNNRLSDPVEGISDGTMTSVLGMTCHSAIKKDFKTWAIHLSGLRNMIELRGGFDALSNNPKLRLLILWVEVAGACRQDIPPLFPLPTHLLPTFSSTSHSSLPSVRIPALALWKSMFPLRAAIVDIFDDVSLVITLSRSPSAKKDAGHFNLLWITPLLHCLLSLSTPNLGLGGGIGSENGEEKDVLGVMQEVSRLGIILFFAEIRRKCGDLGVPTEVQSKKLRTLLSNPGWSRWALFEPLILWVLFFGALEAERGDRGWFCNSMVLAARNIGIKDWKGVVSAVSGFLWIGDVFEGRIKELRTDFDFDKYLGAEK